MIAFHANLQAAFASGLFASALLSVPFVFVAAPAVSQPRIGDALSGTVAVLEQRTGGRIGVSVTDLGTGSAWSHRETERFPIASTFKAFLCGHLLSEVDAGTVDLQTPIRFEASELESYSPVTKDRVGGKGMSLFELCEAATATSDNTATNLVMRATGGPQALSAFMRSIGDKTTRLDRYEPELNDVGPGEERDTTSPQAAAESLRALVLGDALGQERRRQLESWLVANQVGGPLLRASFPKEWRIADRTGAGEYGSRGVIAIIWPTKETSTATGPLAVAVYLTGTTLTLQERNAVIAEIGAAIVDDLAH
jgi:beta-lactamase class A